MRSEPLSPSPIAAFLLDLAERKASGTVDVAGRRISISDGEVLGVWPGERDESIGDFLAKSGRIADRQLRQARVDAEHEQQSIEAILLQQGAITEADLNSARRALWLDRLVRALRDARDKHDAAPALEPGNPPRAHTQNVRMLNLTLDALARCAAETDAVEVGSRLNDRVSWTTSVHTEAAQRWAAFGTLPDRPAVSTILARNPAAAPHIAALLRAGLITVAAPGQVATTKREITLPPPPLRVASITARSFPPPSDEAEPVPVLRPPRMRLDPGADIGPVPTIERVTLRRFPVSVVKERNALNALEDHVSALEAQSRPGEERAEAYSRLADAYLTRVGSVEDAARAYREAAAALPSSLPALEQAARLCNTLGQSDLALAYAEAMVAAAQTGRERARALRLSAALGRPTGRADSALEALCEAAAEDETDPEPHEIVARNLAERGNLEGAIAHGRLAASVWMADYPDRARSMMAWIHELGPTDAGIARDHARALLATGHPEAAVAILAEASRALTDPDEKRALTLDAAQHAEAVNRPDLAAELLTEAFDAEPHVDLFYEPLLADLASAAAHADRAVIAVDIARCCEGEARADWLCVAGEATLLSPRGSSGAARLFAHACAADSRSTHALSALREQAVSGRDLELLADALERAADVEQDPHQVAKLLGELAALAEDQLGAVGRAFRAWQKVATLFPEDPRVRENVERLSAKARIHEELVATAERELETAQPEQRPRALRGLMAMLRDLPQTRPRLARLHVEYLQAQPDDETAAANYEWLLALTSEWATLAAWLHGRLGQTFRGPDRLRLLDRLMLACAEQGDDRGMAEAAMSLLSLTPEHPEAIARLNRAAVRLNDPTIRREALTRSAQVAQGGRQRARALAMLAGLLERTGEIDAAVAAADQALLCDRKAADAARLLLRHAYRLPTERATAALDLSRDALGDSQPLLSTLARAAMAAGDLAAQQRALDAWCRLSPLDPDANLSRLAARMKGDNPQAIRQAGESCLALDVVGPSTAAAMRAAISRLAGLGAIDHAATLAQLALTALGGRDANLLDQAVELARRSGQRNLLTTALEHRLATLEGTARIAALREIADHHRSAGDVPAEAHALVRLLPLAPSDDGTLDRLAVLYGEQGDGERLLAALSLAARGVTDPTERRRRLLDMAAASMQVLGDRDRALGYVREVVRDLTDDRDSLLHALGALFTISADDRSALHDALSIAKQSDARIGGTICEWIAKTAEDALLDPELALLLATQGLDSFPNQAGLLLMVERLALSRQDVEIATQTYGKLVKAAMGRHGRRALFYRAGRWLERAGQPERALDEYVHAFEMSPGAGVAFRAIERVARATGKLTSLVNVYETLAHVMHQQDVQSELLQQAAELCLDGANDQPRAFHLLLKAWRASGDAALQDRLTQIATQLWRSDPAAGSALLSTLVATMNERAEKMWDAAAKIDALVEVARIENDLLDHRDAAIAALRTALSAAKGEEVDADCIARMNSACAKLLPDFAPPPTATTTTRDDAPFADEGTEVAWRVPPSEPARAEIRPPSSLPPAAARVPTPAIPATVKSEPAPSDTPIQHDDDAAAGPRRRQTGSYERPAVDAPRASIPVGRIAQPRRGGTLPQTPRSAFSSAPVPTVVTPTTAPIVVTPISEIPGPIAATADIPASSATTPEIPAPIAATPEVPESIAVIPEAPAPIAAAPEMPPSIASLVARTRQDVLRENIARGDLDACEELSDLLAVAPDGVSEAHAILRMLVERQPWRTRALRNLLILSSRINAAAEERTLSEIVSVFDGSIAATTCPAFSADNWHDDELHAAVDGFIGADAGRVLAITWDAARAMPRFRKHLASLDLAERDRVVPGVSHPVAEAMLWAASTLRLEAIPLYLRRHDDPKVFAAATNPPCLVATTGATRLGSTLLFELASQLFRAQQAHVILATLSPGEGHTLVQAVNAAFGPAGGAPVSREAAQLASELWHTMPMRAQREVRDLLQRSAARFEYEALTAQLTQASARAGLIVAGSPRNAIFALTIADADCRQHDLTSEGGFSAAAHASTALQAVIRFALSDAYLLARMRS